VSYNSVLDFNGSGTGGAVTGVSLDATLNFGTGDLGGNIVVDAASNTWDVQFATIMSGAQFSTANPGSTLNGTFNSTPGVTGTLAGSLTGDPSGFGAQAPLGMGGVFDFESSGPTMSPAPSSHATMHGFLPVRWRVSTVLVLRRLGVRVQPCLAAQPMMVRAAFPSCLIRSVTRCFVV
jgi:hypothetical protein